MRYSSRCLIMKNKLRCLHISDIHNFFEPHFKYDLDVDIIVCTGDAQCYTETEFHNFVEWYQGFPILYKIYVAGNHDKFIYENRKFCKKVFEEAGIIYLDKESVVIDGIKFYGEPTTPTFGNWFFMANRDKMCRHWAQVPDDVDVLLTHGPAKGILDLTKKRDGSLEMCGCNALNSRIKELKQLQAVCFGHIHNCTGITNVGLRIIDDVTYSNAAGVKDACFDLGIIHFGNTINIEK